MNLLKRFVELGFDDINEVKNWIDEDFTPEEAKFFKDRNVSPYKAVKYWNAYHGDLNAIDNAIKNNVIIMNIG